MWSDMTLSFDELDQIACALGEAAAHRVIVNGDADPFAVAFAALVPKIEAIRDNKETS